MKISVISENDGWIYGRMIEALQKYSKNKIVKNSEEADVYFYLPYYLLPNKPKHIKHPCVVWLSHQEQKNPLKDKFISAAQQADFAISHSQKYMLLCQKYGIVNIKQIIPGVDLGLFSLRGTERKSETDKLIVGYSGRSYESSSRKNPALLKKIVELPFVEFRSSGGKMDYEDLPKLYADSDIMVSPSLVEGGPMAIQEALAVGTPIILYDGVGTATEYGRGVIRVPFKDDEEFLGRLKTIWKTKSYLYYRTSQILNEMRQQVKDQTWEIFAKKFDGIFTRIGAPNEVR